MWDPLNLILVVAVSWPPLAKFQISMPTHVKKNDAREMESFYQQYYENYVRALDKGQQGDRFILKIGHI